MHAIELATAIDDTKSVAVAQGLDLLACIARDRGQIDQSVDLFRKRFRCERRSSRRITQTPPERWRRWLCTHRAGNRKRQSSWRSTARHAKKVFPAGHWAIWNTSSILGGAYAAQGEFAQAEPLLLDSYKGLENTKVMAGRPRLDAAGRLVAASMKSGANPSKHSDGEVKRSPPGPPPCAKVPTRINAPEQRIIRSWKDLCG